MTRAPSNPAAPSLRLPAAVRLVHDWKVLCDEIGDRRAGGTGELRAVEYLLTSFARAGWSARREPVPCTTLDAESHCAVAAQVGGRWMPCAARELVGSASTPRRRIVEGEVIWIEMPEMARHLTPRNCRGRVVLLFGPLLVDARQYQRLVQAAPAALLHVDDRLPYAWAKSDALYPYWTRRYGAVPTVSIPYQVAWQWKTAGVRRVRVQVTAMHRAATSANVVATLPGSDPRLARLLVTAHHDTQPATTGADDNASGVVCLLEMARSLAARPRLRRTVEFVSFGAEEQLSVGAVNYVRRHQEGLGDVGLVVNLDNVASPLGHFCLFHSGQPGLGGAVQSQLRKAGLDVEVDGRVCPFADHFPFAAAGVPSVWLYRSNVSGGHRWQHHSQEDSLQNVSVEQADAVARAVGAMVGRLAGSRQWRWKRTLPSAVRAETARLARELFGLRPAARTRVPTTAQPARTAAH